MNRPHAARSLRCALAPILLFTLAACREQPGAPAQPRIEGRVVGVLDPEAARGPTPAGEPLDQVRVTVENLDVASDDRGRFTLAGVSQNERLLVHFERDGYAPITVPVLVPPHVEVLSLDVAMVPRASTTVRASDGATLSRGGTTLEIRPNAFVDARGRPVDGEVEVSFTPVSPNTEGSRGTPGDMTAYDGSWEVQPLLSLLMFELSAEQGGERVYFAEATRLTVDVNEAGIPLPEGWEERTEQGVPFWSFGDELGRWVPSNTVHFEGSLDEPLLVVEVPGVDMRRADWRFRCAPDQICLDGSDNTPGEGDDTGDSGEGMNIIGGSSSGPTNVTLSAAQTRAIGMMARCTQSTTNAPFIDTCSTFSYCTGTVISDQHVLTAAHCVDAITSGSNPSNVSFIIGDDFRNQREHIFRVSRVDWNTAYVGGVANDVAVLTLATPIDDPGVPVVISPISLFDEDLNQDQEGRLMENVGFGRTSVSGSPSNSARNWIGTTLDAVHSTTLEAFGDATHNTCHGDSGGPWLMMDSGSVKVIGVHHGRASASSGDCDGNAGAPAMDAIYPWIVSIVGQDNLPADPIPSMPGSYGPPPQWFNIDMFGAATGIQGDVVDAVGEPLSGAYVSMWTEEGPDGHTYTYTNSNGHFSVYPVNADSTLAISAAVTLSGDRATSGAEDIVYGGIDAWDTPSPMPRSPSSAYGTIDPNPIVIPICTIAGEITLASVDDPTTGQNVLGSAFFWDNDDERVPCVEPAQEFYVDECEVRPRNAPSGGTEDLSTQWQPDAELESVGSSVSVRGGQSLTLSMSRAEGADGPFYAGTLSGSASAFMNGPFNVTAGGFTTTAVLDPDAPTLTGTWRAAAGTRTLSSSRTIQWTAQGDPDDVLFFSLIPDDANGQTLHCAMLNDGEFLVPSDLVSSLPSGGYTAAFYYESRGYAAIGDGTAARVRALSVVQRDARR